MKTSNHELKQARYNLVRSLREIAQIRTSHEKEAARAKLFEALEVAHMIAEGCPNFVPDPF